MHILVLSTMYPNSKIYLSGIFVHEQVKALISEGLEVTVVAPVPYSPKILSWISHKWKKYREIPRMEEIDGIKIYHSRYLAIPKGFFKQFWSYTYFLSLRKLLKKVNLLNFDLIHAHGSSPSDHAAYLLSKDLNIPFVITVHGDTVYELVKHTKRFKNAKKALLAADAVVCVSSQVLKRIVKYIGRQKNNFIVYNGFNQPDEKFEHIQKDNNKLIILFVATLIERKGCEYLLKAFEKIYNKYPFANLIVGGGGKLLSKMKKLAKDLNISSRIHFTGVIQHNEVMKYMDMCDIFILPSWNEAFGVVYLEAMSRKKPIICTEGEGITDIVENGVDALLVKPRDSESVLEALSTLINNSQLRTEIAEKGYEKIKNLTWANNAIKMNEIYNKILLKRESE